MLGGLLLCWLGLLPLGALAVLDTNLGNQTIERVSISCLSGVQAACWRDWGLDTEGAINLVIVHRTLLVQRSGHMVS